MLKWRFVLAGILAVMIMKKCPYDCDNNSHHLGKICKKDPRYNEKTSVVEMRSMLRAGLEPKVALRANSYIDAETAREQPGYDHDATYHEAELREAFNAATSDKFIEFKEVDLDNLIQHSLESGDQMEITVYDRMAVSPNLKQRHLAFILREHDSELHIKLFSNHSYGAETGVLSSDDYVKALRDDPDLHVMRGCYYRAFNGLVAEEHREEFGDYLDDNWNKFDGVEEIVDVASEWR